MAKLTPIGYNTGGPIIGTEQIGNLAIGTGAQDYSLQPGGVKFWMTPNQDLGYVIAKPIPSGNQPNQFSIPAYVGFNRSTSLTDESFISIAQKVAGISFIDAIQAKTWLNDNGYWTSYGSNGGTTGDYFLLAQYNSANNDGEITFPNHNAETYSLNPNLIGQAGYAIYINRRDSLGGDMLPILFDMIGNSGTLTLTQGANSVTYSFTNTAFSTGSPNGQYYWDDVYEGGTVGDITVVSAASGDFDTTTPITITVTI